MFRELAKVHWGLGAVCADGCEDMDLCLETYFP